MTEDNMQKEVRLTKELARIKAINANKNSQVKKRRDFTVGLPRDTSFKAIPHSADNPDVITLPPKQKNRKENIPF